MEIRGQTGEERQKLETHVEAEKCAAKRQVDAEKVRLRAETDAKMEKELRRTKEIVGQEYDFRLT